MMAIFMNLSKHLIQKELKQNLGRIDVLKLSITTAAQI